MKHVWRLAVVFSLLLTPAAALADDATIEAKQDEILKKLDAIQKELAIIKVRVTS